MKNGFLFYILVLLIGLGNCSPSLEVNLSGARRNSADPKGDGGSPTIEDPDYEPTLAEWTQCPDPTVGIPAPTGPIRLTKEAYINTLYLFLNSRGTGNALNDYLRLAGTSDVPYNNRWQGTGLLEISAIPEDSRPNEFYTSDQSISESHVDAYMGVAHSVASQIQASPAALTTLVGPCYASAGDTACIESFLNRAFRSLFSRPADPGEITRYQNFFSSLPFAIPQKWGTLIRSLLIHPDFIFINPRRGQQISTTPNVVRLTPFELARKLSYAATAGPPDNTLWATALDGSLLQDSVFQQQVNRLLSPPVTNNPGDDHSDFQLQINKFYRDYMRTYEVNGVPIANEDQNAGAASPPVYTFNNGYLNLITGEGYSYFYNKVWSNQTYSQLLLDDSFQISYFRFRTEINPAQFPQCPSNMRRNTPPHGVDCPLGGGNCVCLSADWSPEPNVRAYGQLAEHPVAAEELALERKTITVNIPTRPGILGRHNFTLNPSGRFFPNLVHSGQKVKSVLACDPTPVPNFSALPADFRSLLPRHQALGVNTADWYKNTTSNPVCMTCHHGPQGMESWGRVFNEFDGFSRTQPSTGERIFGPNTGSTPVAVVPLTTQTEIYLDEKNTTIANVKALAEALAASRQSQICFSRKVFEFFEARPAKVQDSCAIKLMAETTATQPIRKVLESYFLSPQFKLRRLPD